MGGACSKDDSVHGSHRPEEYTTKNLDRDKGSSIITRKRYSKKSEEKGEDDFSGLNDDDDGANDSSGMAPGGVDISKGGSFVFPSTRTKEGWRPGDKIERPESCPRTQFLYINLETEERKDGTQPQQLLQLTYGYVVFFGFIRSCRYDRKAYIHIHKIMKIENPNMISFGLNGVCLSCCCCCRYSSIQGVGPKPPQKPNQDSLVVLPKLANRNHLAAFGVFDGHGPRGEDASVSS